MIAASVLADLRIRCQAYRAYQKRLEACRMRTRKDLAEIGFSRSDIADLAGRG